VCIFVRSTWRRRHELCSDVCYIVRASFDRFALGCWLTQGYDNSMIYIIIYTGIMNDLPSYAMMDDDMLWYTSTYCTILWFAAIPIVLSFAVSICFRHIYILYVRVFRSLIALILHCLLVSVFSIDLVVLVCHVRLIETYYWRLLSDIWLLHSLQ
jgi:hypothetical protein